MNESSSPIPATHAVHLGIRGLPHLTDSMIVGGLYCLIAETPPARFPILAATLGSALDENMVCSVILGTNPAHFLDRIESFGQINTLPLLESNRLRIFEMQQEFPKKMFRFGADSFVREMEQLDVPENSYLVFDQADDLLALHDISLALDQIEILRTWFEQKRVTALLVFSRVTAAHTTTISGLMDNLTGITRLGGDKDGLELTFEYWQSPDGTIAARNYHLLRLASGFYEATTRLSAVEQSAAEGEPEIRVEAEDAEPHFFYLDPDLGSLAKQLPGIWQRVDTLVSMMHATRNTRSPTCILSFLRGTSLRQLAETVHTLRLALGRRARLVVQEKGASLRYQNEALLLRLGLNLVVHQDVPASRLPLLLESLSGQIFDRDVDINFEAALASVLPTRLRGYLVPRRFVREVAVVLERAETLNIPCAMIVGKPAGGRTMADIITSSRLSRPGDLISADGECCYLFLNACPQSVLLTTLERMLGVSVNDALEDIRFTISRDEIQVEMAALSRAAEQGELPDHSALNGEVPEPPDLQALPAADESGFPDTLPPVVDTYTRRPMPGDESDWSADPGASARPDPVRAPRFAAPRYPANASPSEPGARHAAAVEVVAKVAEPQADAPRFSYGQAPGDKVIGIKEMPRATRSKPLTKSDGAQQETSSTSGGGDSAGIAASP